MSSTQQIKTEQNALDAQLIERGYSPEYVIKRRADLEKALKEAGEPTPGVYRRDPGTIIDTYVLRDRHTGARTDVDEEIALPCCMDEINFEIWEVKYFCQNTEIVYQPKEDIHICGETGRKYDPEISPDQGCGVRCDDENGMIGDISYCIECMEKYEPTGEMSSILTME